MTACAYSMPLIFSDQLWQQLCAWALKLAGVALQERQRAATTHRFSHHGLTDDRLAAFLLAVEAGDAVAIQRLQGLLTPSYTLFFREAWHFDLAVEHLLWTLSRRGRARVWLTAVSTGEEAYSLVMRLAEVLGDAWQNIEILATDIDQQRLLYAQQGEYPQRLLAVLTPERQQRFVELNHTKKTGIIRPELRQKIDFHRCNLAGLSLPDGKFDLVMCRNVLIYFSENHRYAALEQIHARLQTDALLLLDPVEGMGQAEQLFYWQGRGVYLPRIVRRLV